METSIIFFMWFWIRVSFSFAFLCWILIRTPPRLDTARPTVFAASCASLLIHHAKVNLILYACLQLPILNGMLLHPSSYAHNRNTLSCTEGRVQLPILLLHPLLYAHDRNTSSCTEGREDPTDAPRLKVEFTETWKRIKRRIWMLQDL
jgi:hypothetical protein